MTLREAAQAAADVLAEIARVHEGNAVRAAGSDHITADESRAAHLARAVPYRRVEAHIRAALAQPEPDRWGEGYRAGLEAASKWVGAYGSTALTRQKILALPVPPATPPREVRGCKTPGCGFPEHDLGEHPCGRPLDPAPSAKHAESEVGWMQRFPNGSFRGAMLIAWAAPGYERVRITVEPEPAPVEPEETP